MMSAKRPVANTWSPAPPKWLRCEEGKEAKIIAVSGTDLQYTRTLRLLITSILFKIHVNIFFLLRHPPTTYNSKSALIITTFNTLIHFLRLNIKLEGENLLNWVKLICPSYPVNKILPVNTLLMFIPDQGIPVEKEN